MRVWAALLVCFALAGCDKDRIGKLEKENADLKAKVDKQDVAVIPASASGANPEGRPLSLKR
jgi:hypothetical protein